MSGSVHSAMIASAVVPPAIVAVESHVHGIGGTIRRNAATCPAYGLPINTGSNSASPSAMAKSCHPFARGNGRRHCANASSSIHVRGSRRSWLDIQTVRESVEKAGYGGATCCVEKSETDSASSAPNSSRQSHEGGDSINQGERRGSVLRQLVSVAAAGMLIVSSPADATSDWTRGTIHAASERASEPGLVLRTDENSALPALAAKAISWQWAGSNRVFPSLAATETRGSELETVGVMNADVAVQQETDLGKLFRQAIKDSNIIEEEEMTSASPILPKEETPLESVSGIAPEEVTGSNPVSDDTGNSAQSKTDDAQISDVEAFEATVSSVDLTDADMRGDTDEPVLDRSGDRIPEATDSAPMASALLTENVSDGGASVTDRLGKETDKSLLQSETPDPNTLLRAESVQVIEDGEDGELSLTQDSVNIDSVINSTFDVVDKTKDRLESAASEAGATLRNGASSVNQAFSDGVQSIKSLIDGAVEEISGSFRSVTEAARSTIDASGDALEANANGIQNNVLRSFVKGVEEAGQSGLSAAGRSVSALYDRSKAELPPDAREIVESLEDKAGSVAGPATTVAKKVGMAVSAVERAVGLDPDDPAVALTSWLGLGVFLGIKIYDSRFGGYAGDLTAEAVAKSLKEDKNVLLVDIRPQERREEDGVPDLRRSSRYKIAAVAFEKVKDSERSQLRDADETDSLIAAAKVANLKNVKAGTKIIVLDNDGSSSKRIARAINKRGIKRSYRLEGGFKAWKESGLRVKEDGQESALTILKEETEAIVEEVNPTPLGVAAVATGFLAAGYALYEWEKALQLIGILGTLQLTYSRTAAYKDIEDLKNDVRLVLKPLLWVQQGVVWALSQADAKRPVLATTPAIVAVQEKVMQAAAKLESTAAKKSADVDVADDEDDDEDYDEEDGKESEKVSVVNSTAITDGPTKSEL